jgi:hypothetical protein
MQSARSASLFFHLKLPKMLRCQRIPPQTLQGGGQRHFAQSTPQSIGDRIFAWCFLPRSILAA